MQGELERARERYDRRAWADAFRSLTRADAAAPLGGEDLERLAMCAYLTGRDDAYLQALDRAHRWYAEAQDLARATRCAFWLGLRLMFRGEAGPASGWLGRAQRLLERQDGASVEAGYLLLPTVQRQIDARDWKAACENAERAVQIGEQFGDGDLVAVARHLQGRALLQQGRVAAGIALLDETMVAVVAGDLSPLVTGLVYCSVIDGCQEVCAYGRAREWTCALARWCEEQPEMVAFTGVCQVHRAEIMQRQGAWPAAIEAARTAGERCTQAGNPRAAAAACYQRGEIHRLQGDCAAAEEAYGSASEHGYEPQPGLALLRLAQGQVDAAVASLKRVLSATADPMPRARQLPAYVEIMLAAGELDEAERASCELWQIAECFDTGAPGALGAVAAQSRGAVELARGDARAALVSLRAAWRVWQEVEAPYLAARARVLIALTCRALGDDDGTVLELNAARSIFQQLGARPDLARVDSLIARPAMRRAQKLTPRELQVLCLVAAGKTNKAIAAELSLSEKTIDRHVSKIFDKLDVPSRAAATAYAYTHKLICLA